MTEQSWTTPLYFELDKVETNAEEEKTITLDYTPPVELPPDAELETNELLMAHEPEPATVDKNAEVEMLTEESKTFPMWWWLLGSVGLFLLLMSIVDAYQYVAHQYENSFLLGLIFSILLLSITITVSVMVWRAYKNILTLRTVSHLQSEGQEIISNNSYGHAIHYVNRITPLYNKRTNMIVPLERFYATVQDSHRDVEMCQLFSTTVMKQLDNQAYQIVVKRSQETALMVMLSYIPLLTTILTLWRNTVMVRDIATLYSTRPGFFASMGLMGGLLQNLIYANISETLAESGAEIVGGSLLSTISAQAAQGVGSGVLTARLGLQTMQACRPLPFSQTDKPSVKDVRREIIASIKPLFGKESEEQKSA